MPRHQNNGVRKPATVAGASGPCVSTPGNSITSGPASTTGSRSTKSSAGRLKDENEAKAEAEKIRIAIRAGTFGKPTVAPVPQAITLKALGEKWMEMREGRVARPQSEACASPAGVASSGQKGSWATIPSAE